MSRSKFSNETIEASSQAVSPTLNFDRLLENTLGMLRQAAMWMSSHKHTSPLFFFDSLSLPTKERLAAMRGTAPGRHTDLECAPLRHKAPGSLSHGSNRQEFSSPGSPSRRVVPWGDVSSWVKGAE